MSKYDEIIEFAVFIHKECFLDTNGAAREYFVAYKNLFLDEDANFPIIANNTMRGIEKLKNEYIRGN